MDEPRIGEVKVTVLVLTRNRADELRACLQALETSVGRETFEVLVVDNGSTDDTPEVAAAFPKVNTLRLPKNFGSVKALNIGIRTAKGEYVLLTGPSFEVLPDTVERMRTELQERPDAGAVCPYVEVAYKMPDKASLSYALHSGQLPDPKTIAPNTGAVSVDYPRGAPILVKRTFLTGMNFFDERYGEYWWDLELCWQIRNAVKQIYVLTDVPGVKGSHIVPPSDAVEAADFASGAASFLAKHSGSVAGLKFRTGAILSSAGRVLTLRQPGFHFKRLMNLVGGQKIDGTQV